VNLAHNNIEMESKVNSNITEILETLPTLSGIYQFKNENNKVIYVGKALNLRSRVRSYFRTIANRDAKTRVLVEKVRDIEIIVTDSEVEALILESNLIKSLKPRYNILLKDDKSFPFIRITNEPYPQVFSTRKVVKDGSKYFGPYTDVKTMYSALKIVRDIFMIRNCKFYLDEDVIKNQKVKICLQYQIKKCGAPCTGYVSENDYKNCIKNVIKLLHGRTSTLIESMKKDMEEASNNMKYEEAAILKNNIELLNVYSQRQKVVSLESKDQDVFAFSTEDNDACAVIFKVRDGKLLEKRHYYISNIEHLSESEILENIIETFYIETDFIPDEIFLQNEIENIELIKKWLEEKKKEKIIFIVPKAGDKEKLINMCKANAKYLLDDLKIQKMKKERHIPHSVKALQRDLRLKNIPERIDCFDISNIQGSDSVASMVVFIEGKPKKSEYRKYIIKTVKGPNDFASMQEVITRRYTRAIEEKLKLPDLIMVDGGKGQLSSAVEVLKRLNLQTIPIIGLAKRLEEIFFHDLSDPQLLPKTSSSLKLLQNIRDEAHRFAITFHRERRDKRTIDTELTKIESIGEKKAKKLLIELGSVKNVKNADFETLEKVVGKESAKKLVEFYKANI
jgi:excinuclease ABC subunit C